MVGMRSWIFIQFSSTPDIFKQSLYIDHHKLELGKICFQDRVLKRAAGYDKTEKKNWN